MNEEQVEILTAFSHQVGGISVIREVMLWAIKYRRHLPEHAIEELVAIAVKHGAHQE